MYGVHQLNVLHELLLTRSFTFCYSGRIRGSGLAVIQGVVLLCGVPGKDEQPSLDSDSATAKYSTSGMQPAEAASVEGAGQPGARLEVVRPGAQYVILLCPKVLTR